MNNLRSKFLFTLLSLAASLTINGQALATEHVESNAYVESPLPSPPSTTPEGNSITDGTHWMYLQMIKGTTVQIMITELTSQQEVTTRLQTAGL